MKGKGAHMKTVKEVSELTGISIRTLQYYDDIQKIIQHSLEIMSEEDKKIVIGHYGDIEKFKESVAESFKDEKACEHLIKIYGSKEKAVEASLKKS